ncbi:MAG: hypothetical protein ABSH17_08045 [Syntrophobacteraceae bacterium]|jgi:hypothetical protein
MIVFYSERRHFRLGKEIEGLREGVHHVPPRGWAGGLSRSVIESAETSAATRLAVDLYAPRGGSRFPSPRAEKDPFPTETKRISG